MKRDVNARLVHAASLWAGHVFRPEINGVFVHRHPKGGVVIVATDGRRIFVARDIEGACDAPFVIDMDKPLAKALSKARADDRLTFEGDTAVLSSQRFPAAVSPLAFPNYRRAIEQLVAAVQIGQTTPATFNGKYLADLERMRKRLGLKDDSTGIKIVTFADSAALILWPGEPRAFGALMSMRDVTGPYVPAWMKPVMEAPEKLTAPAKPKAATRQKRAAA